MAPAAAGEAVQLGPVAGGGEDQRAPALNAASPAPITLASSPNSAADSGAPNHAPLCGRRISAATISAPNPPPITISFGSATATSVSTARRNGAAH